VVQGQLAAIQPPAPAAVDHRAIAPAVDRPMLVAIAAGPAGQAPLRAALDAAVVDWARAHHRTAAPRDPGLLERKTAARTVAGSGGDLAIGFWILDYAPELGALPMARARVRVRIADAREVRFDRVVVTDTVLGERGLAPAALAARVAREILAILAPHVRRSAPAW
jgi:hypothetical protein